MKGITLYLYEHGHSDGCEGHPDLSVTFSYSHEKGLLRESRELPTEDIIQLVGLYCLIQSDEPIGQLARYYLLRIYRPMQSDNRQEKNVWDTSDFKDFRRKLFTMFGITDSDSFSDYPGSHYSIDEDVYDFLWRITYRRLDGVQWIEYRPEGRIKYAPWDPTIEEVFLERDETGEFVRFQRDYGRTDPTYYKFRLEDLDTKILTFEV
ncbi:MAG: hypothetical protein HZB66_00115 [Candidatus Aenigmarchaeota archaeon]|nr:hypothetical protein [Candidatus Aenigmarchaeota archaeon]